MAIIHTNRTNMDYHISQKNSMGTILKYWTKHYLMTSTASDLKKGNSELKNQIRKTLDEMFKEGSVDKIAQNYSYYGIPGRLIRP